MASGLGRGHDFRCIIDEWGRLDESIGKMGDPEKDIQFDNLVEIDRKFTIPRAVYSVRLVGRLEPPDGPMFPDQVPGWDSSCYLQHQVMSVVTEQTSAPIPQLLGYEYELEPFGRPFFAMGFVAGEVPADNPRYSQSGFLVDTSTPPERRRLVESGLQAMAEIHGIDRRTSGLTWLDPTGRGQPTQADQVRIWRSYVEKELRGREHPVLTHAPSSADAQRQNTGKQRQLQMPSKRKNPGQITTPCRKAPMALTSG